MFLNGNTNRSASRITTQNQSRVVLNNVIDRRNPKPGFIVANNLNNTDITLLEAQGGALIYAPEPIVGTDFYTENNKFRDTRYPKFLLEGNPTITTTYSSITYSNVIGANNANSYSAQILSPPSPNMLIYLTTNSNNPAIISISFSNLKISTIYSTALIARNNFGVRFFTLPDVRTNILMPPEFPGGQTFGSNIFFDSILYSNIHVSEYADPSLYSVSPPYPFATRPSVGYTSNYTDLFIWGLPSDTSYEQKLNASNILGQCNLSLPTTTLPIAAPRFQTQTGIFSNATSNTLTYSNIIGATNVNLSNQYSISLKNNNYTIPTNMYSANIGLDFKFGAPSNVFLTISGQAISGQLSYTPTLIATNSINSINLPLTTLRTPLSAPKFLIVGSSVIRTTFTGNTIHIILFKGATSITNVSQYTAFVSERPIVPIIITLQPNTNPNTFSQSNVEVKINGDGSLIKNTQYNLKVTALNSLGSDDLTIRFRFLSSKV